MKTLSIRQPWAYLIASGQKDIENRTWKTSFRGKFLIHAGKKLDKDAYNILTDSGIKLPPVEKLKFGGIIGKAEITGCVSESKSEWFNGPFGFKIERASETKFIPCKGRLYFFEPSHL